MFRYCLFFLCLVACGPDDNEGTQSCNYGGVDYVFSAHYQNCIAVISQYQMGNEKVTTEYFLKALTCLGVITGIKDNVYRGDSMGYMSQEDFYKDLEAWSHWYAENKHKFSFDDAYKKFEDHRKANNEEATWPPMVVDIMVINK